MPHRQAPWPYRGGQTGLGIRLRSHCAQFRYPKLNACVCRSRHTHALTPFSANWPPDRDHSSIRRQRFRTIAIHPSTQLSHHTDNHRIKASRALDHRTVWHGLRAITTHPSTRRCDQCLSLEWNNNPSLRRSMLRAVTFDARFSVYRTPKTEEKATAPGYPHRLASKTLGHRTGLATSPKHVSFAGDGSLPPCECSPRATTGL